VRKIQPLFLIIILMVTYGAGADGRDRESPQDVFEQVWNIAKERVYPPGLVETHFSEKEYQRLRKQVSLATSVYELTPTINQFLSSLGVSHTQFYTDRSSYFSYSVATRDKAN
jgi:hypothetical protein